MSLMDKIFRSLWDLKMYYWVVHKIWIKKEKLANKINQKNKLNREADRQVEKRILIKITEKILIIWTKKKTNSYKPKEIKNLDQGQKIKTMSIIYQFEFIEIIEE